MVKGDIEAVSAGEQADSYVIVRHKHHDGEGEGGQH